MGILLTLRHQWFAFVFFSSHIYELRAQTFVVLSNQRCSQYAYLYEIGIKQFLMNHYENFMPCNRLCQLGKKSQTLFQIERIFLVHGDDDVCQSS